ncbi:hypothetical protein [Streptomyces daliensis]|uniref:Uncharacterized protein n=1 Tax=Streptomyces daliensis TaxID=299421 RepID=A0A8T4IXR3_9ACTN|nr:hypothetical protein [Streptomyces daliensis]
MSTEPDPGSDPDSRVTPDKLLHSGGSDDVTPEDVVLAAGRDVTPENLRWARKRLDEEGRRAIEKLLP